MDISRYTSHRQSRTTGGFEAFPSDLLLSRSKLENIIEKSQGLSDRKFSTCHLTQGSNMCIYRAYNMTSVQERYTNPVFGADLLYLDKRTLVILCMGTPNTYETCAGDDDQVTYI